MRATFIWGYQDKYLENRKRIGLGKMVVAGSSLGILHQLRQLARFTVPDLNALLLNKS